MRIKNFEYRDPTAIIANKTHLRKYDHSLVGLITSINTYGFVEPIIVDQDYRVIVGDNRLAAARRLQLKEIPVLVVEASEKERKEYPLISNQISEMTGWNFAIKKDIVEENDIPKGLYGMSGELATTETIDDFFVEDNTISLFEDEL